MKLRVLTALVLIPLALLPLALRSHWPLLAVAATILICGYSELRGLFGIPGQRVPILALASLAWFTLAGSETGGLSEIGVFGAFFAGSALGAMAAWWLPRGRYANLTAEAAALWIACPLIALYRLHGNEPGWFDWKNPVFVAVVPIWAGDTAAMLVGRAIGRHKLAPNISPGKTVEGAVANLLACVLVAAGIGAWVGLPLAVSIAVGVELGIVGQLGDLFQSALKRRSGAKDSGTLLPGHGGLLDRIDSLLLSAPLACLILAVFSS